MTKMEERIESMNTEIEMMEEAIKEIKKADSEIVGPAE